MAKNDAKEAKRKAVVVRLKESQGAFNVLSGMWDEKTLDALILALGVGHVVLDD